MGFWEYQVQVWETSLHGNIRQCQFTEGNEVIRRRSSDQNWFGVVFALVPTTFLFFSMSRKPLYEYNGYFFMNLRYSHRLPAPCRRHSHQPKLPSPSRRLPVLTTTTFPMTRSFPTPNYPTISTKESSFLATPAACTVEQGLFILRRNKKSEKAKNYDT
jgi:hypothetical protein